jgi:hypothetical protein
MASHVFLVDARDFFLLHSVHTDSRFHPASYPIGATDTFCGDKVGGGEADCSLLSNASVVNGGAIPLHPIHLHGMVLAALFSTLYWLL